MPGKSSKKVTLSPEMKACLTLLVELQNDDFGEPFCEPVDWKKYNLLDYPNVIKEPMDLGTIEANMESGQYATADAFAYDMRLVWKNCMTFNHPDSDLYKVAEKLSKKFEKAYIKIKKQYKSASSSSSNASAGTASKRLAFSQTVQQLNNVQLGELVDLILKNEPDAITEGTLASVVCECVCVCVCVCV